MRTTARLSKVFLQSHPEDGARVLEAFPAEQSAIVLARCKPTVAAGVIRRMMPGIAASCLASMPLDESSEIVACLSIDTAARIVRLLGAEVRDEILDTLPSKTADALRRMMDYPLGTAGSLMDPLAFTLPSDITVAEAKARVEGAGEKVLYYLYIVDREYRLVGILNLREFILAPPEQRLAAIMRKQVVKVRAGAPLEQVAGSSDLSRFLSFPVVDKKDTFLGVLSTQTLSEALGRDDPGKAKRASVNTVVALGELYWVTLSGMLSGAQPPRQATGIVPSPTTEPTDGR